MSFDVLGDVNYLAVLVATIAWFALGAIWYAQPVFGRMWMRSLGIQMPEGFRPNPMLFVGTFVAYFVTALSLAMLARATGSVTVGEGIVLGVVTGAGLALMLLAVGALYERKPEPGVWFGINGIFNLIAYLLVAVIVTVWD
jgi:hypothetical protein